MQFLRFVCFVLTGVLLSVCYAAQPPAALKGETLFTIPWGNNWGQTSFISETEVGEGMYYGPTAMALGPDGSICVYDAARRRFQCFLPDGTFSKGAELGRGTGNIVSIVFGASKTSASPPILMADEYGYIVRLDKFGPKVGQAKSNRVLEGVVSNGMTLHRLGMTTPGAVFLEVAGMSETPYIQCYNGDRYRRRFNATDLVSLTPRYYGMALDRQGKSLFVNSDGQLIVQEIDGYEAEVSREIPVTLPQIPGKQARWHLIGAGTHEAEVVFFFTPVWPLGPTAQIYAVSERGSVLGTAKAALPGGKEAGAYLGHWNRLIAVNYFGHLYLSIPGKGGIAIIRYKLPSATR